MTTTKDDGDLVDPDDREAVVAGMLAERAARERIRQYSSTKPEIITSLEPLWELARKWYDIAADDNYGDHTRNTVRDCANQLEDALAEITPVTEPKETM